MTSLVTGGTGFLGSNLCARLLREGKRVICLDNNYTGRMVNVAELRNHKSFRFVLHNVCDPFDPDEHLDEIYNLACPASPPAYQGRHSIDTTRTCVLGALNMLELAKATRRAYPAGEHLGGVRRTAGASAARVLSRQRESHRHPRLLRRGQTLRRESLLRLSPARGCVYPGGSHF